MELKLDVEVALPVDVFVATCCDEDFNDFVFKRLEFRRRERIFFEEVDGGWRDVVRYEPAFSFPGILVKLLRGRRLGWDEHRSFCERELRLETRCVTNIAPERVTIEGRTHFRELAPELTLQSFDFRIAIRAPAGIRQIVEHFIVRRMRNGFASCGALAAEFLSGRGQREP